VGYFLSPSGLRNGHAAVAQRMAEAPKFLDDVGHDYFEANLCWSIFINFSDSAVSMREEVLIGW